MDGDVELGGDFQELEENIVDSYLNSIINNFYDSNEFIHSKKNDETQSERIIKWNSIQLEKYQKRKEEYKYEIEDLQEKLEYAPDKSLLQNEIVLLRKRIEYCDRRISVCNESKIIGKIVPDNINLILEDKDDTIDNNPKKHQAQGLKETDIIEKTNLKIKKNNETIDTLNAELHDVKKNIQQQKIEYSELQKLIDSESLKRDQYCTEREKHQSEILVLKEELQKNVNIYLCLKKV